MYLEKPSTLPTPPPTCTVAWQPTNTYAKQKYLQVFVIVGVIGHSLPFKGIRVRQLYAGVANAQVAAPGAEGEDCVGDAKAADEGHVLRTPESDLRAQPYRTTYIMVLLPPPTPLSHDMSYMCYMPLVTHTINGL